MEKDTSCKTPRWRMLKNQLNNLSAEDFMKTSNIQKNAIIIDVRTKEEYLSGHIPQAINIDYMSDDFWDKVEQLDASKKYFIYCRSGRRSIRVCTLMKNGGFENAKLFNLDKGLVDWVVQFPNQIVQIEDRVVE